MKVRRSYTIKRLVSGSIKKKRDKSNRNGSRTKKAIGKCLVNRAQRVGICYLMPDISPKYNGN